MSIYSISYHIAVYSIVLTNIRTYHHSTICYSIIVYSILCGSTRARAAAPEKPSSFPRRLRTSRDWNFPMNFQWHFPMDFHV